MVCSEAGPLLGSSHSEVAELSLHMSWSLVRCGPHLPHGKLWLSGTEVTFGRAATNTYVLTSSYVSRRHAIFMYNAESSKWELQDNESANGMYINGFRTIAHRSYPLIQGDTIGFGAPPSAESIDDVFVYRLCFEVKQEPVDNPSLPDSNLPKPTDAVLPSPLQNANINLSVQHQATESESTKEIPNAVNNSASSSVAQHRPRIERTVSEDGLSLSGLSLGSPSLQGALENPVALPGAVAVKIEPGIEMTTAQTRLQLSRLTTPLCAIKQEPGIANSSVIEALPGQSVAPVTGSPSTSSAGETIGAKDLPPYDAASALSLETLKGILASATANPVKTEVTTIILGRPASTGNVKIDRSALFDRIIILDSDSEEDGQENAMEVTKNATCSSVAERHENPVEGNGAGISSDDSDDVEFMGMGYSQQHEIFEISDDEEYFASSQPSAAVAEHMESSLYESIPKETVPDDCDDDYLPDVQRDYDYDEMEVTEASRSPLQDLDKPGPSGLQKQSSVESIRDSVEEDDFSDSADNDVPATNGIINDDEEYFPALSQDFFNDEKSADDVKEGELDSMSDEPDEQSIRRLVTKGIVQPAYPTAVQKGAGQRRTIMMEAKTLKDNDVPATNGIINDEEEYFPALSQDFFNDDKSSDDTKEGELDSMSDEPDEQSMRRRVTQGIVRPAYPAAVQKSAGQRRTIMMEAKTLDTSVRRDRRYLDKGSRANDDDDDEPFDIPAPTLPTNRRAKIMEPQPNPMPRRRTARGKKNGIKENVLKSFNNRVPIPGGGSDLRIRDKDSSSNDSVPSRVHTVGKTSSAADKRSMAVKEGPLKEVDMFATENRDDLSEPESKRAKDDASDQKKKKKKKGNTVATESRFVSRSAMLNETMIAEQPRAPCKRRFSDPKVPEAKRAKNVDKAPSVVIVAAGEGNPSRQGFAVRTCSSPVTVEDDLLPKIDMGTEEAEPPRKEKTVRFAPDAKDAKAKETATMRRKTISNQKENANAVRDADRKGISFNQLMDVYYTLLYWNVKWPKERQKNGSNLPAILGRRSDEAKSIISHFESVSDYFQIFSRLLLYETWELVCDVVVERKVLPPPMRFVVFASKKEYHEVYRLECQAIMQRDESDGVVHPQKGHLVTLDLVLKTEPKDKNRRYITHYGYVVQSRELQAHELQNVPPVLGANVNLSRWKIMSLSIFARLREGEGRVDMCKAMRMDVVVNIKGMIRYCEALFKVARSPLLKAILSPQWPSFELGNVEEKVYRNFNLLQTAAIKKVVAAVYSGRDVPKICLVQGPPGTGKTKVVSQVVIDLLFGKWSLEFPQLRPKVLLCAPSNAAVDEDITRILKFKDSLAKNDKKVNVLRMGPESSITPSLRHLSLHTRVKLGKKSAVDLLQRELREKDVEIKTCGLLLDAMDKVQKDSAEGLGLQMKLVSDTNARDSLYKELQANLSSSPVNNDYVRAFKNADVIASTLDSIYCERLAHMYERRNDHTLPPLVCVIDEAAQCTEPATLIPLMYPVSKLILVGDHQQLPATVHSPVALQCNFRQSLFERLNKVFTFRLKSPCIMLTTQYRMHPEICQYPSRTFYDGKLETDGNIVKAYATCPFQPYMLFNVFDGLERHEGAKGDIFNPAEAKIVCELCKVILRPDRAPLSVGVITFYRCQKLHIMEMLKDSFGELADKVDVNTVDGFQGKEKDVIILSAVRAHGRVGFLEDAKRMNVALTRAKCCFYICGHVLTLESHELWAGLIADARERRKIENISNDRDMAYLEQFVLKVG